MPYSLERLRLDDLSLQVRAPYLTLKSRVEQSSIEHLDGYLYLRHLRDPEESRDQRDRFLRQVPQATHIGTIEGEELQALIDQSMPGSYRYEPGTPLAVRSGKYRNLHVRFSRYVDESLAEVEHDLFDETPRFTTQLSNLRERTEPERGGSLTDYHRLADVRGELTLIVVDGYDALSKSHQLYPRLTKIETGEYIGLFYGVYLRLLATRIYYPDSDIAFVLSGLRSPTDDVRRNIRWILDFCKAAGIRYGLGPKATPEVAGVAALRDLSEGRGYAHRVVHSSSEAFLSLVDPRTSVWVPKRISRDYTEHLDLAAFQQKYRYLVPENILFAQTLHRLELDSAEEQAVLRDLPDWANGAEDLGQFRRAVSEGSPACAARFVDWCRAVSGARLRGRDAEMVYLPPCSPDRRGLQSLFESLSLHREVEMLDHTVMQLEGKGLGSVDVEVA